MSINYYNNNTIIFTLARMNPPTPGHLFLIETLIEEALEKNIDHVYIILSKTNDNNENPISCEEKLDILGASKLVVDSMTAALIREMITKVTNDPSLSQPVKNDKIVKLNNMNVITLCVPDNKGATPFTALSNIIYNMRDIQDINLFLIIGDDRADMLDNIANGFYMKNPRIKSMNGKVLGRPNMKAYKNFTMEQLRTMDMRTIPVGAFSASFVRNLVKYGLKDKFIDVYSPYLNEDKINELYLSILNGISSLPDNKKKEAPKKPLKYSYPLIKEEEEEDEDEEAKSPLGKRDLKDYYKKAYEKRSKIMAGKNSRKRHNKSKKYSKKSNKKTRKNKRKN